MIKRLLRLVGRWARKPVNHTSWVAVVTPTDRPKSVRNRCLIELFCGVVCVVTLPFWHFCWCRGFCHRTESDLFLFLLMCATRFSTSGVAFLRMTDSMTGGVEKSLRIIFFIPLSIGWLLWELTTFSCLSDRGIPRFASSRKTLSFTSSLWTPRVFTYIIHSRWVPIVTSVHGRLPV